MLEKRKIYLPPISFIGPGAILDLVEELSTLNIRKLFIVTDALLVKIGVVSKITDALNERSVQYVTYDNVLQNPTCKNVENGLKVFRDNNCDYILTIGGGSPQDCGKAIGILATNGGNIKDYEGINVSLKKSIPIAAINTTAGTASEVTINYVITDEQRHIKMVMVDKNCLVSIAVNDPLLMLNKPADLTAATGMDALTHAIEAYISKGSFYWSDNLALCAIKLISESLRDAVNNGNNLEARSKMAWAQFIAGQAFSNCGLGFVHSAAHQLGGQYNIPHGVANAVLLPHVMRFNLFGCPEKFAAIAQAMGIDIHRMTTEMAGNAAIEAIQQLAKDIGIPNGIAQLGVKKEDIEVMAENALLDVCTGGNPIEIILEDALDIYRSAL